MSGSTGDLIWVGGSGMKAGMSSRVETVCGSQDIELVMLCNLTLQQFWNGVVFTFHHLCVVSSGTSN
jgi:hypothetical protein